MFPSMLRFLFKAPQHRDQTKFSKRSTPAKQIKVGDILFCKKDFLESHNVSPSLLKVVDKSPNGNQLECHKPVPANEYGHRRPVTVSRSARECFYLVANHDNGVLTPVPDLHLLDITELSNIQKIHIGQVFEQK